MNIDGAKVGQVDSWLSTSQSIEVAIIAWGNAGVEFAWFFQF